MKINRIIAAVTALAIIGGAYPFAAENKPAIESVFAAEENESSIKFACEKKVVMQGEPVVIQAENLKETSCKYEGENIRGAKVTSDEHGCIFEFKAEKAGEARFLITYIDDEVEKKKEFIFTVTDEEYVDENSVKFACEKQVVKQGEPIVIQAENLKETSCKYEGENIRGAKVTSDEHGCIFERSEERRVGKEC